MIKTIFLWLLLLDKSLSITLCIIVEESWSQVEGVYVVGDVIRNSSIGPQIPWMYRNIFICALLPVDI